MSKGGAKKTQEIKDASDKELVEAKTVEFLKLYKNDPLRLADAAAKFWLSVQKKSRVSGVFISPIVSPAGKPFVHLEVGNEKWQMDVDDARELSANIAEAAANAVVESVYYLTIKEKAGEETAFGALRMLRENRTDKWGKKPND